MFEAHLSDPAHGEATAQAETPEEAVEIAFRQLAKSWTHPNDLAKWPEDQPMFDGEIRNEIEVWWENRLWAMIGVVRELPTSSESFKVIDIEVVDWVDILEQFEIPHPSNDHTFGDKPIKHYQQRNVMVPDEGPYDVIVIWEGSTAPTDAQIIEELTDGWHEENEDQA